MSVVKSTGYSSGGPEFNSLHPHDSSQHSVTPVPGLLTPSHAGKTPIHIKTSYILKNPVGLLPWAHSSLYFTVSPAVRFGHVTEF